MSAPMKSNVRGETGEEMREGGEGEQDVMDAFIDRFKGGTYKGRWNEETWEEEMERVPMFMRRLPENVDARGNPELACLQHILHSPLDSVDNHKMEGNVCFRRRDYPAAIAAYSLALSKLTPTPTHSPTHSPTSTHTLTATLTQTPTHTLTHTPTHRGERVGEEGGKGEETELKVVLFSNRAAANYHLGNYGSALMDATSALSLKPSHVKATIRAIDCCLKLERVEEAVEMAERGLWENPGDNSLQERRQLAQTALRVKERDRRRVQREREHRKRETQKIITAIMDRKIRLAVQPPDFDLESNPDAEGDEPMGGPVGGPKLGSDGRLRWPVTLLYPEFQMFDIVSEFHEDSCFQDQLSVILKDSPPWDMENKYRTENLQVLFMGDSEEFWEVEPMTPLSLTLTHQRFVVLSWPLEFLLLPKSGEFLSHFTKTHRVHLACH